jgi:hypothetical protein
VTLSRLALAVLLAVPALAQVRTVPPVSVPALSAAAAAAAHDGPSLSVSGAPALAPTLTPALTERAVFELQKDADRVYGALAAVHARERAGAAAEATAPAKRAVAADLRGVLAQLPPDASDWNGISTRLKALRAERAALERATGENPEPRAAAARARADLNARIYALQLRAAWAQLMGGAPLTSPAFRRNAALWSLVGAYNSAAAGRADAGWREGLDRAEAVFGDGRTLVVSRRWRNVATELEDAARDARNGRRRLAADRFADLAELLRRAPIEDAEPLARHRAAASALHAAAAAALAGEDGGALSARALAVKELIPHPKLAEATAVSYSALDKAARAQAHALDSGKAEYLSVLAREAALARWAEVLAGPRPTAADRAAARADLAEARAWAARGFVGAKQIAAQDLDAALAALDRGDDALAARHAGWARDELAQRRADLERIAAGLRARLARLASR